MHKDEETKKLNMRKKILKIGFISLLTVFLIALLPFPVFLISKNNLRNDIFRKVEEIPEKRVAIVFGAAIWAPGSPSDVLRDRILTSVQLYKEGKVEKIIMSGDNRTIYYDEPSTMVNYAIENGVPEEVLQPDYAGRRTYDTCYRAKNVFNVTEAILVTQEFHLTRAIYTCNSIGVKSIGIVADQMAYENIAQMQLRDIYAMTLAIFDVHIRKPKVVLGEEIEI